MNEPELHSFVVEFFGSIYRPSSKRLAWQWAEDEIVLTAEESPGSPGPYDSSLSPWHRFIMEFWHEVDYNELFVMKSSQSGVTLAVLLLICYIVAEMPVHVLYAIDTRDEALKISKARLQPLLRGCPAISGAIDVDDDDMTNLFMQIRGMVIHVIGGGSAGAFANKTVGLVILDELDKHPPAPQGEANTVALARSRIKKVPNGKLIGFSSPKNFEGELNQNYLTGTRDKMFVPCPHCGHRQELVWEQVRFDHCKDLTGQWLLERVKREAFYQCIGCDAAIHEADKPAMLRDVQFLPTNLNLDKHRRVPGRKSLHESDLYSIFPGSLWGDLAVEFIAAQGSLSDLQNFFNSRLGLPRKERTTIIEQGDVQKCCGAYEHGTMPVLPAFSEGGHHALFMASDVQGDRKKWVKGGFLPNGDLYLVDYGSTLSYNELLAVADEPTRCGRDRVEYRVLTGLIDEGHETKLVRDFCQRSEGRFFPCKGRGGIQVRDVVEEKTHFIHNGRALPIYHFSDDDFKTDLYVGRIAQVELIKSGQSAIPRLWLPVYTDAEFIEELCQESRQRERKRGRMVWSWVEPKGPNDFGDAVKMLLVLWYRVREYFPLSAPPVAKEDVVSENLTPR